MGFFYQDEDEEFNNEHHVFNGRVGIMIAIVSGVILVILMSVLAVNNKNDKRRRLLAETQKKTGTTEDTMTAEDYAYDRTGKDIEQLYRDGELRAEDLDIWNMYSDGTQVHIVRDGESSGENAQGEDPDQTVSEPSESPEESPSPGPGEENGPEEELIENVPVNSVDFKNIKVVNDRLSYLVNGAESSYLGVDISKESGTVDFNTLKQNGVKFVMIKVAGRGYDSGIVTIDDNYEHNINGAKEAGLDIGIYFSSRAVSVNEAIEEAHCCIDFAKDKPISYPVAFVMDGSLVDSSRTDSLTPEDRTKIVEAFASEVKSYGYTPIIYGTKDQLLNDIDPKKILPNYDVWLYDTGNMPDYPYQFKLWKYVNNVSIPGISQRGAYTVSFVDYSGR